MSATACVQGIRLSLNGRLNLDSVPYFTKPGHNPLTDAVTELDLSGLSHCDSAGVALLIQWVAEANAQGRTLTLVAVPDKVKALLELYDIEFLTLAIGREGEGNAEQ
ncbi:STAS domain-containing protein [Ferrimonas sediminicola]|uniref:STAS domain-containing protein n=1 Tax=Ferrimonas sediminicola TaxID=2569538 RepID=A0A4U1BJA5_9GAMM|nr:STAS domain-containing protein [Ferrimonas sediminicola]TKB51245.1 STAS domain-containing protein [Ferrimonas sediminicola]